jgi:hypothetical protein
LLLCLAGASRAAGPARVGVHTDFDAAAGCPSPAEFEAAVASRLGYDPVRASAQLQAHVSIVRSGRHLVGVVALSGPGGASLGQRQVQGRVGRCGALVETLALALSLALDAEAASRRHAPRRLREGAGGPAPRRAAEADAAAPDAADRVDVAASIGAPRATPSVSRAIDLGLRLGVAEAPSPSLGVIAGVRLGRGAFEGGLELGGAWPAGRDVGEGRVRVSSLHGAFVPCGRFGWFRACGVGRVGLVVAAGERLEPARRGVAPTASLGVRASVLLPIGARAGIAIGAELAAALLRTRLRVGDAVAWTTPRVGGAAFVAATWRLR